MAAAAAEVLLEPELKQISKMRLNCITLTYQTFFSTKFSVRGFMKGSAGRHLVFTGRQLDFLRKKEFL